MSSTLKTKSLNFNYLTKHVLKNIHLEIKPGTFTTVLGPNGSGKTTLLKNLCGSLSPKYGDIFINETPLEQLKPIDIAKEIAVVHQSSDIYFDFSIYEIVMMGRYSHLSLFQGESSRDDVIVNNAMLDTDTWNIRDKSIHEVSGGEQQRVIIARALVQQADILLLDEPISHLDLKHQLSVLSLCKQLCIEKNIGVLATMHDINLASRFSDRIVLLHNGKIVAQGLPEVVLTKDNIEKIYDVEVSVQKDSNGRPYIMPL